jgi:hypothetical protein
VALYHPRRSSTGAKQQPEHAGRPASVVAPTARACMRVVPFCPRAVWPLARSHYPVDGAGSCPD